MADETTVEKHYCYACPTSDNNALIGALMSNANKDTDASTMMTLMNQNNAWNNNPFVYLVWMMMMRYMNGNGWNDGNGAENFNSRQIATLQDTVANNHNNDLVMQAMNNNQSAIRELAQTFNTDLGTIQQACCNINASIQQIGGQIGYSAESVKNAIALGDNGIIQAVNTTACATQKAILEQGYQSQLATERQTNMLGSQISNFQSANQLGQFQMQSALGNQINDTRNAMVNGFANIGYANAQQTCEIVNAINASQQKTSDLLNNHWQAETSQALQDSKFEISQLKQNQYIASLINNGGCNCNS